jgi:hypothetical protein
MSKWIYSDSEQATDNYYTEGSVEADTDIEQSGRVSEREHEAVRCGPTDGETKKNHENSEDTSEVTEIRIWYVQNTHIPPYSSVLKSRSSGL